MKKTTYILIGVIALTAVTAFLVPPMLFKPSSTVFLVGGEMCPAKTINSFSTLSISYKKNPRMLSLPSIEITETDSATAPTITLSKALDENAWIDTAGNALSIIIDLHTSDSDDKAGHVVWETGLSPVATLTVPRGMLKNITATGAVIRLNGFTTPVRFSATSEMSLDGCEIPTMEIRGRIQDANNDSKIDLRGNSRIGKLDVSDTDITIDSDESSAIDTLVTRSRHAFNNIFSRNSTIGTIINESNTETNIHIAGKATIK